jgi:hypothetical protein
VLLSTTSSHPKVTTYFSSRGILSSSNPSSLYHSSISKFFFIS